MKKFKKILEHIHEPLELSDEVKDIILNKLVGETISDEWEKVDSRETSDDNSSINDWIKSKVELAGITSHPNQVSSLDRDVFKVRYSYKQKHTSFNSRSFCAIMMAKTLAGVVYRKEDIDQASFSGVNQKFGHAGKSYSLFKYKGGVNCHHVWEETLYKLKENPDGTYVEDKSLSSSDEITISKEYNPSPNGISEAKTAPIDMPNKGRYPG